ncbi:MAG: oligosaccharide flippase family protein [Bacteroidales bacterium]|nr:oligosaccharide flippase family protein [Bacteroidales bacterium]
MLNKLKTTFKHTFIYSLGNISSKLIGFILLPLYTNFLSTGEYGTLAILEITSTIFVTIFSLSLSTTMVRWCSDEKSKYRIKSIVFTTLVSSFIIVIFLNLILFPFSKSFSTLFFNSAHYTSYFQILIVSASFEILNLIALNLIRFKEKPKLYISLSIIKILTVLSFNIYFIKYLNLGIKGVLLSILIGNVLFTILTIPTLLKNIVWHFYFNELKEMLKYGFPLIFSTMSMMLLTMGDRYIIKHFLDYSSVGIYSLGYKIASVLNVFIIQSFQTGFLPIAYKNFDKPDAQRFFSKTLTYYTLILVITGLSISLFSEEIITLFSKNVEYNIAYTIVPFISLAFIFKGIQYVFSLGLHFVKKTKYNAIIVLLAALINLALNFILIPQMGIYGAAIATVFSWFIMTIAFYKYSNRLYKVKYEIKKLIILLGTGIALYCISLLFFNFNFTLKVALKLGLLVLFPFILFLFRFYEKIELERLKEFRDKLLRRL